MRIIRRKFNFKRLSSCFLTLTMILSLMSFINPSPIVSAKTVSSDPAADFTVNIIKSGQSTPTLVHKYSIDDMKKLETSEAVYYTSIDSMPAPVGTKAQGVLLSTLLNDLEKYNSAVTSYSAIKLFTTDAPNGYTTIDKNYLYSAPRYYYPNLISTWDSDNQKTGNGATTGAIAVEPMFAVDSYQGRYFAKSDLDNNTMDEINMFRLCFGQTENDVKNGTATTNKFGKWINRIDIILPDTSVSAPVLAADTNNNTIGQSVDLTFADDTTWEAAITGVTVNGIAIDSSKYSKSTGKITIDSSVFTAAGDYKVAIQATGYNDATVMQTIKSSGIPVAAPTLTADTDNNIEGQPIDLTFADDTIWRVAITGIAVNGKAVDSSKYSISTGKITIDASVFKAASSSVFTAAGNYTVAVQATGYNDTTVTQTIKEAPILNEDTTNNTPGHLIELPIGMNNSKVWSSVITGITVNGKSIDSSKYNISSGRIIIDDSVFTTAGDYTIAVQATGYNDVTVTQTIKTPVPATEFTVNIIKNWKSTLVHKYTIDEMKTLQKADPVYYSSIESVFGNYGSVNTKAPVGTKAQGVLVSKLIEDASKYNSEVGKYNSIKIYTNGSTNFYSMLSKSNLYGTPHYYYPNLISTWDGANNKTGNGADANPIPVEPMFAITSYQGRNLAQSELDKQTMDGSNMFRFCIGQKSTDITGTSETTSQFAECVNRIDIYLPFAPTLKADTTNNTVGHSINLTFTDDAAWRSSITGITANGSFIDSSKYSTTAGAITIDGSVFTAAGNYAIAVQTTGYNDGKVTQTIQAAPVTTQPVYTITPVEDATYQIGTDAGITTLTVKSGVSGLKYFSVNITPVKAHPGNETVVFAKYSNGVLMSLNATVADFDTISSAEAGFNVKEGDVVKIYVVDQLTNDTNVNPVVFQ